MLERFLLKERFCVVTFDFPAKAIVGKVEIADAYRLLVAVLLG